MIRALFSAGSGMSAQQTNVDNIAHNLANANTVGFKMRRAQFQDLLYQNLVQPGAAAVRKVTNCEERAAAGHERVEDRAKRGRFASFHPEFGFHALRAEPRARPNLGGRILGFDEQQRALDSVFPDNDQRRLRLQKPREVIEVFGLPEVLVVPFWLPAAGNEGHAIAREPFGERGTAGRVLGLRDLRARTRRSNCGEEQTG